MSGGTTLAMILAAVLYCAAPPTAAVTAAGPPVTEAAPEVSGDQTAAPTIDRAEVPAPVAPPPSAPAEPHLGATGATETADQPVHEERGEQLESGVATVYAANMEGRITASGEPYAPKALTAAHRTLPLGTRLRVVNVANLRSVVVRVNDRWASGAGRVVNLSLAAADALGFGNSGMVKVRIELLTRGPGGKEAALPRAWSSTAANDERRLPPRAGDREGTKESRCENEAAILGLSGTLAQSHVANCMERRTK